LNQLGKRRSSLSQTSREEDWANKAYRLAYVSPYVRHDLETNGENQKVIQELLRHANLKVTMDTYVQAVSDEKRKAQSKVVRCFCLVFAKREAV
jgi:integrase